MAKSPTTWEAAQLRSFISRMATQFPRIPLTDIKQIFNACSHHYRHFQTCCMKATLDSVAMNTPRNQYPTFEHLILFLYLRWIHPTIPRQAIFGMQLTEVQKTNLGEALDMLIHTNAIPPNVNIGPRLSFIELAYHDRFGFRDDPVLLQRMWYMRAYVVLADKDNGPAGGEKWKWYDHRLTLVIYSWVRHNRKYHGCPKNSCHCRSMIDLYGMSITSFKALYMALERQCLTQLQYIRAQTAVYTPANMPGSLSRAQDAGLFTVPGKAMWPSCLIDKVSTPDPPVPATAVTNAQPPLNVVSPVSNTTTTPASIPKLPLPLTQLPAPLPAPHVPSDSPSPSSIVPKPLASASNGVPNVLRHPTTSTLPPPPPSLPPKPQVAVPGSMNVHIFPPKSANLPDPPIETLDAIYPSTRSQTSQQGQGNTVAASDHFSNPSVATEPSTSPSSPASSRYGGPSPSRARMFPSTSSTEASTQISQSAAGWSTVANAATPISNYSTPSMDSICEGSPTSQPKSVSNPSNSPIISKSIPHPNPPSLSVSIPSAPRSMRIGLDKAAEVVIPTGPRALRTTATPAGTGVNGGTTVNGSLGGRTTINGAFSGATIVKGLAPAAAMAGVPSGPRAMRKATSVQKPLEKDAQGDVSTLQPTQEPKSSLVAAWESPTRKSARSDDNPPPAKISSKGFKTGAEFLDHLTSRKPYRAAQEAKEAKEKEKDLTAPPIPLSSLGKRTRMESNEDETMSERKGKGGSSTPKFGSEGGELSSLPPMKRARSLVSPKSPDKEAAKNVLGKKEPDGEIVLGLDGGDADVKEDNVRYEATESSLVEESLLEVSLPSGSKQPSASVSKAGPSSSKPTTASQPIADLHSDEEPYAFRKPSNSATPKPATKKVTPSTLKSPATLTSGKSPRQSTRGASARDLLASITEDLNIDAPVPPPAPKTPVKWKEKMTEKMMKPRKSEFVASQEKKHGKAREGSTNLSGSPDSKNTGAELTNTSSHQMQLDSKEVAAPKEMITSNGPQPSKAAKSTDSSKGNPRKDNELLLEPLESTIIPPLIVSDANTTEAKPNSSVASKSYSLDPLIAEYLHTGPPYPFISVSCSDIASRAVSSEHEAQRILSLLFGLGISVERWMIQVGQTGFAIKEEAAPIFLSSLTTRKLEMLKLLSIEVLISPPEASSDQEEDEDDGNFTSTSLKTIDALSYAGHSVTIFDGRAERRLRDVESERKRLRMLVEAIAGVDLGDIDFDFAPLQHAGCDGVVRMILSASSDVLQTHTVARLGQAALTIYRGDVQMTGPVFFASKPTYKAEFDTTTFDWKAMRAEVLKMRLPWESSTPSSDSALSSPALASAARHTSNPSIQTVSSSIPPGILERPGSWLSSSYTFSRLAASGKRWIEFTGEEYASSDEDSEDERSIRLSQVVW